ncbi:uncharacterized protein PRCAT00001681001 [Priceomyces carsonii]|uniref:uncharacterized protein n=1 Tax=Priceomyces carsonii TaxID=28549 RepID=UPI002ED905EE|nr:unnamed protein product [Priceomyces carsonii]
MINVLGGIYISSIEDINHGVDFKKQHNISHILALLPGSLPDQYINNYVHKQLEITDETTTNIIDLFPDTNNFIDAALFPNESISNTKAHKGAILVHCSQGISRSVAFVIAYLMFKYNLSYDQASYAVKRKHSAAEPNEGFVTQLKLFEEMGCRVDKSDSSYRKFLVSNSLALDPSGNNLRNQDIYATLERICRPEESNLRCRKCRQVLALGSQIESHEPPDSSSDQSLFVKTAPNSKRVISSVTASQLCSHFFLNEPLSWMKEEIQGKGEIEGKLMCPKCNCKVGAYSWRGSRCSCGRWMTPAIHLHASKVDKIKISPQNTKGY